MLCCAEQWAIRPCCQVIPFKREDINIVFVTLLTDSIMVGNYLIHTCAFYSLDHSTFPSSQGGLKIDFMDLIKAQFSLLQRFRGMFFIDFMAAVVDSHKMFEGKV